MSSYFTTVEAWTPGTKAFRGVRASDNLKRNSMQREAISLGGYVGKRTTVDRVLNKIIEDFRKITDQSSGAGFWAKKNMLYTKFRCAAQDFLSSKANGKNSGKYEAITDMFEMPASIIVNILPYPKEVDEPRPSNFGFNINDKFNTLRQVLKEESGELEIYEMMIEALLIPLRDNFILSQTVPASWNPVSEMLTVPGNKNLLPYRTGDPEKIDGLLKCLASISPLYVIAPATTEANYNNARNFVSQTGQFSFVNGNLENYPAIKSVFSTLIKVFSFKTMKLYKDVITAAVAAVVAAPPVPALLKDLIKDLILSAVKDWNNYRPTNPTNISPPQGNAAQQEIINLNTAVTVAQAALAAAVAAVGDVPAAQRALDDAKAAQKAGPWSSRLFAKALETKVYNQVCALAVIEDAQPNKFNTFTALLRVLPLQVTRMNGAAAAPAAAGAVLAAAGAAVVAAAPGNGPGFRAPAAAAAAAAPTPAEKDEFLNMFDGAAGAGAATEAEKTAITTQRANEQAGAGVAGLVTSSNTILTALQASHVLEPNCFKGVIPDTTKYSIIRSNIGTLNTLYYKIMEKVETARKSGPIVKNMSTLESIVRAFDGAIGSINGMYTMLVPGKPLPTVGRIGANQSSVISAQVASAQGSLAANAQRAAAFAAAVPPGPVGFGQRRTRRNLRRNRRNTRR